jgi:hypothetical protein
MSPVASERSARSLAAGAVRPAEGLAGGQALAVGQGAVDEKEIKGRRRQRRHRLVVAGDAVHQHALTREELHEAVPEVPPSSTISTRMGRIP